MQLTCQTLTAEAFGATLSIVMEKLLLLIAGLAVAQLGVGVFTLLQNRSTAMGIRQQAEELKTLATDIKAGVAGIDQKISALETAVAAAGEVDPDISDALAELRGASAELAGKVGGGSGGGVVAESLTESGAASGSGTSTVESGSADTDAAVEEEDASE